tara:strand:+ start:2451 stop:3665 length:1215 start_codon:yes stop_codon:yes gene_type:complete
MFKEGSLLQQPDELIVVDGEYYAVYNYTTSDGYVMPLVVFVDLQESILESALSSATEYTIESFAQEKGSVFLPLFNLSQVKQMDPDNPKTDIDAILENLENDLERKAKYLGKSWYLDNDVQQLFAYGALTGESITDYLDNLQVFQDYNKNERAWLELQYTNPDKAKQILKDNASALRLQAGQLQITGEGVEDLITQLAADVSSGRLTSDQAALQMAYLVDDYKLQMAGGQDVMDSEYLPFLGRINQTQSGMSAAKSLVTAYLGVDAARAFSDNGLLENYASMLRADASAGEGVTVNENKIKDELQAAHDKLFPNYEGSQHAIWSAPLYKTAQTILGKAALSNADKKEIDILSQEMGGDFSLFAGALRKRYENDPTYQDKVLGDMTGVFKQDVSGIFSGQSLVGR